MLKLAFRNLFRYRKRTIITSIAICVGITIGIFATALLDGVDLESNRNLLWYETSSIKIFEKGWFDEVESTPIEYLIDADTAAALEDELKSNGITSYTKEFIENSDISFYEDPFPSTGSIKAQIHALDISNSSAYEYKNGDLEGEWFTSGSDGVVLGSKLAADMGAEIGYYITVQTKGNGGFLQAFDVPVIGIVATGNPIIDNSTAFFDYDFINDILELDGSYTSFAISFGSSVNDNIEITDEMLPKVTKIANDLDLDAHGWKDIAADIIALAESKSGASSFIIVFIFIIAIVGVTNTMVMAISERKNEIAMLRSLGYKPYYIKSLFSLEGGLIGVFGSIVGSLLGIIVSLYFQTNGMDFTSLLGDMDIGYRINAVMYAELNISMVIQISIFAIAFCALAAFFAVRKSTNGEIAEQMRSI